MGHARASAEVSGFARERAKAPEPAKPDTGAKPEGESEAGALGRASEGAPHLGEVERKTERGGAKRAPERAAGA